MLENHKQKEKLTETGPGFQTVIRFPHSEITKASASSHDGNICPMASTNLDSSPSSGTSWTLGKYRSGACSMTIPSYCYPSIFPVKTRFPFSFSLIYPPPIHTIRQSEPFPSRTYPVRGFVRPRVGYGEIIGPSRRTRTVVQYRRQKLYINSGDTWLYVLRTRHRSVPHRVSIYMPPFAPLTHWTSRREWLPE